MNIVPKPLWKNAPDWANYLTMDCDVEWNWHECKPEYKNGAWVSAGKKEIAFEYPSAEKTIEERPENISTIENELESKIEVILESCEGTDYEYNGEDEVPVKTFYHNIATQKLITLFKEYEGK